MTSSSQKIKCLGIASSPRFKGNTALLLKEALAGAQEGGAETELIYLRELSFAPCVACNSCFKTGSCIVDDDMRIIYEKLLSADRIILAAPIFSMGMCAQGKSMVDRCQPFWATHHILKKQVISDIFCRPPRKGFLISTAGSKAPNVFSDAQRVTRYFFDSLEAEYLGDYCYQQVDEAGAILKRPEAIAEVFEAGKNLAY